MSLLAELYTLLLAARLQWSTSRPVLLSLALLIQFCHRKLRVPAIVSHIAVVVAEFRVFNTVAAHFGVLVVDRVDEDEDDGGDNYCDRHKSGYDGKVVLCNKNQTY